MLTDQVPLILFEGVFLVEDIFRDPDLADIVQKRTDLNIFQVRPAKTVSSSGCPGQSYGIPGHPLRMAPGIHILFFNGDGKGA